MRDLIKAGCVALVLSLSLAAPVAAGPFEDGVAAYDRGDYATALQLFRPLAEQGHAAAQFSLGLMYRNGQGVPQDYAEAVTWYRKAAEQGVATAQSNLGLMYRNGQGVPQDYAAAMTWYRKAAEQGHPPAQHNLGVMYGNGQGVPQDYVQRTSGSISPPPASQHRRVICARRPSRIGTGSPLMTPAQIAEAQRLAREWKPKPEPTSK
jgi:TPR repeat protein